MVGIINEKTTRPGGVNNNIKTVSVILATLNCAKNLEQCLASVRNQNYDQEKIEIIIADGGSTDRTIEIAKKYGATVIPENTGSPEAAKGLALKTAGNEIILEIDDDNILPDKDWLSKMVSLLEKEPRAVGCYPWRYTYRKEDKALNRYFSLFGVNDPVAWFLGKADRQSYLNSNWALSGKAQDKGDYFLVEFNKENLPTVGANGFLIRRDLLMKADTNGFFHIDVNADLVRQGYNKYVVVKNDIVHASGESFSKFFQKRYRYMAELYLRDASKRRYFLYNPQKDKLKIIAYSFYSLTFAGPIFDSLRGYLRIPDPAWFLHPVICFLMFWIYFWAIVKNKFNL
jgi:glycosyltransferase involved in cell wall biosynthesis